MQTDRYKQFKQLLNKKGIFTAKYIKNGKRIGTMDSTILLINVHTHGMNDSIDHVWVKVPNHVAKLLRKYQHYNITFKGALIEVTKPYTLHETKQDIGVHLTEIVNVFKNWNEL